MTHTYEIDRRYPFEATEDSVCPVPDDAMIHGFRAGGRWSRLNLAHTFNWTIHDIPAITHFLVVKYPPKKRFVWINLYMHSSSIHETRECADKADLTSGLERLACKEVHWTDGEGL